jgi:2-keto-4-pentenoate hydratase
MTNTESPASIAARLRDARRDRRTLEPPAGGLPLTVRQAYAVQDELTALYLAAGRRVAGYKLGYTSLVMRRQMGIGAPNYGPLYQDMILRSESTVDGYMQPRLEPEVAVILARDLSGAKLLLHEVAVAVAEVRSCLEIVDSVWRDYGFSFEMNTADGSSAAGVVLGPELDVDPVDCHRVQVSLDVDGRQAATATGAAAGGHPLHGVAWLCARLAARNGGLREGQVVITGGLTTALPLDPGSRIEATYDRHTTVAVRRAPSPSPTTPGPPPRGRGSW